MFVNPEIIRNNQARPTSGDVSVELDIVAIPLQAVQLLPAHVVVATQVNLIMIMIMVMITIMVTTMVMLLIIMIMIME